jgi:peptidoglycan/xylan/chitin deacetylase (PgdA/CDA1 family)
MPGMNIATREPHANELWHLATPIRAQQAAHVRLAEARLKRLRPAAPSGCRAPPWWPSLTTSTHLVCTPLGRLRRLLCRWEPRIRPFFLWYEYCVPIRGCPWQNAIRGVEWIVHSYGWFISWPALTSVGLLRHLQSKTMHRQRQA